MTYTTCADCTQDHRTDDIDRCAECGEMVCRWCQATHGTAPCESWSEVDTFNVHEVARLRQLAEDIIAGRYSAGGESLKRAAQHALGVTR